MRVWCAPLLPPPPPPPSTSYLHLLQSFSQHASVLCLVFPDIFLLLPTTIVAFFLFFSSSLLLLIRESEHTYSRGVYGERWGTHYSSLWSIEDGDEPEESAGWDRSRETHIIHRGLSKPPLPFLLSPLTLCLSLVCSLQEQPPHHFFRAAVPPPPSLSLPHPLFYPSPFLLLAPLWECSEGKRIVRGSCFFFFFFLFSLLHQSPDLLSQGRTAVRLLWRHAAVIPGNQRGVVSVWIRPGSIGFSPLLRAPPTATPPQSHWQITSDPLLPCLVSVSVAFTGLDYRQLERPKGWPFLRAVRGKVGAAYKDIASGKGSPLVGCT